MMDDRHYMSRCLELAGKGLGSTAPNPLVGCVIVHNEQIIGEGFHRRYGGPHAEVLAVKSVTDQSLLSLSTLYVNLEPCSHHGKTPPCADMIISKRIPKVVIGNVDCNPLVSGRGIRRLQDAGIDVVSGVMQEESRVLNRRFFTYHEQKRPYIILKWAQSCDGFLDVERRPDVKPQINWITDTRLRMLVHRWRSEEGAILVGAGTVKNDDPELTTRDWPGANPLRIVVDTNGEITADHKVFNDQAETWFYTPLPIKGRDKMIVRDTSTFKDRILSQILDDLHEKSIQSVIIEGGGHILKSFTDAGLWDEARIFTGTVNFGAGVPAPSVQGYDHRSGFIGKDHIRICYRCKPATV